MLKTNTKKAQENLKKYIDECLENEDYYIGYEGIVKCFNDASSCNDFIDFARENKKQSTLYLCFRRFAENLSMKSLFDYYYTKSAIDILGDILEESQEERQKYSEAQAQEKLTQLIYTFLCKHANLNSIVIESFEKECMKRYNTSLWRFI